LIIVVKKVVHHILRYLKEYIKFDLFFSIDNQLITKVFFLLNMEHLH